MTESSAANHVLVAGASGVIGAAAVEQFARVPGWHVTALSRRRPHCPAGIEFDHVSVDLRAADDWARLAAELPPVTHLVYAAVSEAPGLVSGWRDADLMEVNGAMFRNLLAPLAEAGSLRHVSVLQGGKAYGARFLYAWPSAAIAVMGGEQASKTLLSIQLKNRGEEVSEEEKQARLAEIQARYAAAMNPRYAAARLWVDAILDPAETRDVLARSLAAVAQNPQVPEFRTGVLQT